MYCLDIKAWTVWLKMNNSQRGSRNTSFNSVWKTLSALILKWKDREDNKNTAGSVRWEEKVSASSCENTLSVYFEYPSPLLWGELQSAIASVHSHWHTYSHSGLRYCRLTVNVSKFFNVKLHFYIQFSLFVLTLLIRAAADTLNNWISGMDFSCVKQ